MKRLVLTFAILIGLAAPAWAGLAEGVAAYERGDYATALREFMKDEILQHAAIEAEFAATVRTYLACELGWNVEG